MTKVGYLKVLTMFVYVSLWKE